MGEGLSSAGMGRGIDGLMGNAVLVNYQGRQRIASGRGSLQSHLTLLRMCRQEMG